jgi:hypothetical protein
LKIPNTKKGLAEWLKWCSKHVVLSSNPSTIKKKDSKNNLYVYGQLIFNKGARKIQGEILFFSTNGSGKTVTVKHKRIMLNIHLTPKLTQTMDQRPKTIKHLEVNKGVNL